jgi:DNA repair exonuclease SbcCD nuclease subunit
MEIDILSDIHIDYYFNKQEELTDEAIKEVYEPIIFINGKVAEVLIISGDIGHYNNQNIRVLKYLKEHYYKYILCVLGNHDYFLVGKDMKFQFENSYERVKNMRDLINREDGLYCLNGEIIGQNCTLGLKATKKFKISLN